jgi:hypothetical protein
LHTFSLNSYKKRGSDILKKFQNRLTPFIMAMSILIESTTTRTADGLDFTAKGGKRPGREAPQSLRVKPGASHPVWKTQSYLETTAQALTTNVPCMF